ncbi:putative DNA-binding ribbon-helix-helix protein [Clostridiales Family XIII bacterium PM5-7]
MKEIKVRRIEDAVYQKLTEEASRRNMSMEALVRNLIYEFAVLPDVRNIESKYEVLASDMITMYRQLQKDTIEVIERNNHLLERLK